MNKLGNVYVTMIMNRMSQKMAQKSVKKNAQNFHSEISQHLNVSAIFHQNISTKRPGHANHAQSASNGAYRQKNANVDFLSDKNMTKDAFIVTPEFPNTTKNKKTVFV